MANIKDFAVGLVVTPPSPATTGTTLTLRTGEGATMPTPPFYVTAGPPGELTTLATSEKLLVTAVNGDVLTIVRGQTPTTAKSIAINWIVANALYTEDVVSYVAQPEAPTNTNVLWYDTDDAGTSPIGNHAETVDGYHANSTPTANTIPVLDASAKMPFAAFSNLAALATVATSTTNTGDAGGTYKYLNLGGLKILFGRTAAQTPAANTEFSRRIVFPTGFFSAQPTFVAFQDQALGSVTLNTIIGNAVLSTYADIYWRNSTGSPGIGSMVSYIAIGL